MEDFEQTLGRIMAHGFNPVRSVERFSFGDRAACERLFYQAFRFVDRTCREVRPLPEYEQIIDWMTDTGGKGLILTGDCGRGKTTILTGVLPLLFMHCKGRVLAPIHADQLPGELVPYLTRWAYCVDEVGVESKVNNYGERYEGFQVLINEAERLLKPVFVSTNLDSEMMTRRYDKRTTDRVIRLCRAVRFAGESLRK